MLQFLNVGQRYKGEKVNTGPSSASTSVGAILTSMAVAYPAISPCPIGESLMRATLSPQEAADLLFYLMNVMSTASAATTTPLTKTTYSFIEEGLDARYGAGTGDALKRYRDSHFKGVTTKEWNAKQYEAKIIELKAKLTTLNSYSGKFAERSLSP
jgi:hypothetical protein